MLCLWKHLHILEYVVFAMCLDAFMVSQMTVSFSILQALSRR
jgi:hypothetical protein